MALAAAAAAHHSAQQNGAPRSQRTATRARGGIEMNYTATIRETLPPTEPGTQYYGLDDDDSVPETVQEIPAVQAVRDPGVD